MRWPLPAAPALFICGGSTILLYFFPSGGLFILINALLFLVIILDHYLAPGIRDIQLKREFSPVATIDEKLKIELEIKLKRNVRKKLIMMQVKDEPPTETNITSDIEICQGKSRNWLRYQYYIVPSKRGEFKFGRINCRFKGPLGMAISQVSLEAEEDRLKVYPRLGLSRRSLAAYLSLMRQAGIRPSKILSMGTEFESLREYTPDDEHRQINWKSSARLGKLVTNHYQVEKSQNLILVFEGGRSMLAGLESKSKLDYALEAGLRLGAVALLNGDRVGSMAFARSVTGYIPPDGKKGQIKKIAGTIYKMQPLRMEPDYRKAFIYLSRKQKKRSMICFFSDLIDRRTSREMVDSVLALAGRHLVLLVIIKDDKLDQTLHEKAASLEEVYRKAVTEHYLTEREQGLSFLRSRGVEIMEMTRNSDPALLINRYLMLKSKLKI